MSERRDNKRLSWLLSSSCYLLISFADSAMAGNVEANVLNWRNSNNYTHKSKHLLQSFKINVNRNAMFSKCVFFYY